MKSFIVVLALIALTFGQNPVPIPGLSLDDFNGHWFVVWEFNTNFSNTNPNPISCVELDIHVDHDNNNGTWLQTAVVSGNRFQQTVAFTSNNASNVWSVNGTNFDWVAVDPVSKSWFVGAVDGFQTAFLMAKQKSVSNLILNANILLLTGEGYSVNATNQLNFPEDHC